MHVLGGSEGLMAWASALPPHSTWPLWPLSSSSVKERRPGAASHGHCEKEVLSEQGPALSHPHIYYHCHGP